MLCDLLSSTQAAGNPDSFFRRESFSWWADYFNISTAGWANEHEFDQAYLSAVHAEGATGTPVFGMRLMWESLGDLSKRLECFYPGLPDDNARFQSAFGPVSYVYLSRQDKVAQAVSYFKAEQSGLWHVHADGTERERLKTGQLPVYDGQALARIVTELHEHQAAWADWFARQEIQPVCITYEALSADPQAALATVLAGLGLDPAVAVTVEPRTAKLADEQSQEWAARFRAERGEQGGQSGLT